MGRSSRRKGASGELEVAALLKSHGFEACRTPLSGGMKWKGDLDHDVPALHLEIKRCERILLPKWIAQAQDDCPEGQVPAVVYRSNGEPWRIVIDFNHYMDLQRRVRDGNL